MSLVIKRDLKYIGERNIQYQRDATCDGLYGLGARGRPNRPAATRYVSHFKKYIVDTQPTGSAGFNAIFSDMRILSQIWEPDELQTLSLDWKIHHPGQSFFSDDYNKDCQSAAGSTYELDVAVNAMRRVKNTRSLSR